MKKFRAHRQLMFLLLILLTGYGLRVMLHDWHGLEGDDAVALNLTRYDVLTLIDGLRRQELDVHPPLYFVLLKAWVALAGESLLALRWLNMAADVLSGALLLHLMHSSFGRKAALIAGVLWLGAPLLLYADYTVRMYSLLTLWVTLGAACLLAYIRQPRLIWLAGLGCVALAALYTHIFGALLVIGAGVALGILALLKQLRWRVVFVGWLTLFTACIAFIPFAIPIAQRFLSGRELGAQTPGSLGTPLEIPGQLLQTLMAHRVLNSFWGWMLIFVMAFCVMLLWRSKRADVRALVILFGVSYAGLLVLALASDLYRPRYLAPFVPLWLALLAGTMARLPRGLLAVALGFGVLVSGAGLLDNLDRSGYDDWVAAAQFIETHQQPGDGILIIPDWGVKAFNYHYHGGLPVKALFSSVSDVIVLDPLLANATQEFDRVWLVRYQVDVSDPANRADGWFKALASTITEVFPTAIQVKGYDFTPQIAQMPETARPLDAQFGDVLRVRGVLMPVTQGSAQDTRLHPPSAWVQGTLYLEPLVANIPYTLRIRLTDGVGATWGGMLERENDLLHRYPLSTWTTESLYDLPFDLVVNPAAPTGVYNVELMLLNEAGQPIPTTGADAGQFWMIVGQNTID